MYRSFNIQAVQWFLESVWPQIVSRIPDARFYIVGYKPPPEIQACHDGKNIFVTGFVDDLAPWYQAASVFVSPLLVAGGLLQKILDALAMRVPVVATSVSNHGVGATPGEHILVADGPTEFADAVIRVLDDQAHRERIGQAGYQFVHQRYDLERAVVRWETAWRLEPEP
jgi:glycosyltransferase involved in cell wall biosynthesis